VKSNLPFRTIDANFNRFQEGIRVVEDILRYEYNSPLAKELKNIRHIRLPNYEEIIEKRDSLNDILKSSTKSEQNREDLHAIVIANLKRAEQSARVLEEIYKISDTKISEYFKNARYLLYNYEKEILSLMGI